MTKASKKKATLIGTDDQNCQNELKSSKIEISMFKDALNQLKRSKDELQKVTSRLDFLMKTIPDSMDIVDEDLNVLWANDHLKEACKTEIVGKKCYEMYRDNKTQCESCPMKKRIKIGETKSIITDCVLGGGIYKITHTAMMYEGKRAILEVFKDVTMQKKAEDDLRESERKHKALYESAKDAIMTLEPPTWNFTGGNPATIKMFACKNEKDFISRSPWKFSPPTQANGKPSGNEAKLMIEKAMQKGSHLFEWTHRRKNGKDFPATVLLTRMEVNDEFFLQATVRDITAAKKAEGALKDKVQQMEFMGRMNLQHHKELLELQKENKILRQELGKGGNRQLSQNR